MSETKHKMHPTHSQHSNLKRPTYARVLTPAEFPSKEHDSNVPAPPRIYTAPPCVLIFYHESKIMRRIHTSDRKKPKNHKVHFMDRTKGQSELFQTQRSETKHKMHPTHSQHSISSVQHVHAYLHPANTDRSYNFVKQEK